MDERPYRDRSADEGDDRLFSGNLCAVSTLRLAHIYAAEGNADGILELCEQQGLDVLTAQDDRGMTPSQIAAKRQDWKTVLRM